MKHDKIDSFPYGMSEEEANEVMKSEDVYDVLEVFDNLEDSFNFIKSLYGDKALEFAKNDANQNIKEEQDFIEYQHKNGNPEYLGYASFDVSDNLENYRNHKIYEPSFFWFPSGRVARIQLF